MKGRTGRLSALFLVCVLAGCGEKITLPDASGIPVDSAYVEQRAWTFEDPSDVIEANGRIYVAEGAPGRVLRLTTGQQELARAEGLNQPRAFAVDFPGRRLLVAEGVPGVDLGVVLLQLADLTRVGKADLRGKAKSLTGLATDGTWVYASDPDSGVVHRFALAGEAEGWLVPRGVVADRAGSIESPQFVFRPAGLALDSAGRLLVCEADTVRNWVLRFDPLPPVSTPNGKGRAVVFREIPCPTPPLEGFVLGRAPGCGEVFVPGPSSAPGGFHRPWGAAVDTEGRIYVTDRGNGRVQRFASDGTFELAFGDGRADANPLEDPLRLTTWLGIATRGNVTIVIPGARVWVVDRARSRVRVFEDRRWTDFQQS